MGTVEGKEGGRDKSRIEGVVEGTGAEREDTEGIEEDTGGMEEDDGGGMEGEARGSKDRSTRVLVVGETSEDKERVGERAVAVGREAMSEGEEGKQGERGEVGEVGEKLRSSTFMLKLGEEGPSRDLGEVRVGVDI